MKVSLHTVRQYLHFDLPPVDELVHRINEQLGGVEEIIDVAKKYEGIVIVKVVECAPLEGSDHLNVTKIDDGGVVADVERDQNGFVQVVCGAPNVHAGMLAVWLAPGVTVPETFDKDPFVLSARPLRGVVSNGMLASPKELDFGDAHEGILEIDPNEWKPSTAEIIPGAMFAEVYGLNDTVIDIENKMFTHRPDCFGQLGVAREIAGIFGHQFASPDWYMNMPVFDTAEGLHIEVTNEIPNSVPRFMAVVIRDVTVKPSPIWLQAELVRLGAKPINNIVDVTNYVMLLTAQPMHAYDYDKVGGKLGVRLAHDGEEIALLNGKVAALNSADIVITDGEKPIGIGGVMGGSETEVSGETKNIILECANFDMYTLRRTSMRHGLFTDAVTRFTKGQSSLQNDRAMQFAMHTILNISGGQQASSVVDDFAYAKGQSETDTFEVGFINERLGAEFDVAGITELLQNVEFEVMRVEETKMAVKAPFWRTDIDILEDVVEEVGRLYGFDKLRHELPRRSIVPAVQNKRHLLKQTIRETLSCAGANEALTYSFVHKKLLEKAGQDSGDAYQLSNALSPDLQYLRRTVLPSLLDKIHPNVKSGFDTFALFEIGKGHMVSAGRDEQGVPVEQTYVAFTLSGGDFYQAKAFLEFLARHLSLGFTYSPIDNASSDVFEPKRSASLVVGGEVVGVVGEFRAAVRRNFKLPEQSAGFEIDFDRLLAVVEGAQSSYRALSKFPSAERDVTLQVSADMMYSDVEKVAVESTALTGLDVLITPIGIYQPENSETKNITLRLRLTSHEKTLTGEEVARVMSDIAVATAEKLQATVV